MSSDEGLMLEFKHGSGEAFEELFARYRDPIYAFFRRRLNFQDRAEDLTQETFLAVMSGRERYQPRSTFRTYLFAIALKLLFSERRKQAKQRQTSESQQISTNVTVDSTIWVRKALEKLPQTDREIVMLREYEQLSYDEIGQLLHIPLNTVRSRLFRARMELKSHLIPSGQQAGDVCR